MSHIATVKTQIKVLNKEDLTLAVEAIKKRLKATETTTIRVWQGQTIKAEGIGLSFPKLPYDADLTIDSENNLVIKFGDTYCYENEFQTIRQNIEQAVAKEVLTSAFLDIGQEIGFGSMVVEDTFERTVIEMENLLG